MSHTYQDLALDYEVERQEAEEEWERHLSETVGLFAEGRLRSYYLTHPDVAHRAIEALAYSKALLAQGHSKAALVFAGTAMEIGYKAVLLRPIVSGLDHCSLNSDTFDPIYVLMGHALPEEAQPRSAQRAGDA